MKEIYIGKNEENQRIDRFIRKYMPKAPLSFIYKMIRKKYIKVNQKKIEKNYTLQEGDTIQLYISDDTISGFRGRREIRQLQRDFIVLYEDENILFIHKPQGLLVHGDKHESENTLIHQVLRYLYDKGDYHPEVEKTFVPATVNRLDRNTSGIVVIGKNHESLQNLNEMMRRNGFVHKYYLTIVKGEIADLQELKGYLIKDQKENKVKLTDKKTSKAKEIHTVVKPLKCSGQYSLAEVEIITGRSHQIRLHLASIGHPIIGDPKYGDSTINQFLKEKYGLKSQFLHAYRIYFEKCIGNLKYLEGKNFYAPLPKDLEKIKKKLFGI